MLSASLSTAVQSDCTLLRTPLRRCTEPMKKHIPSTRSGFTLIELIVVITIIVIIATSVFVSIDPARRLHAARNSTRWADVTSILESIKKYQVDNDGDLPPSSVALDSVSATVQVIGESVGACGSLTCGTQTVAASDCGISGFDTDLRPYLRKMPQDPRIGTEDDTRYYVNKDEYSIISIGACDAEGEESGGSGTPPTIEVTR